MTNSHRIQCLTPSFHSVIVCIEIGVDFRDVFGSFGAVGAVVLQNHHFIFVARLCCILRITSAARNNDSFSSCSVGSIIVVSAETIIK